MSDVAAVIHDCDAAGLSISPREGGNLYVHPAEALTDELREKLIQNKPAVVAYLNVKRRLHIHRVLVRLRNIQPYRADDSLHWRGEPTPEQYNLLCEYECEIVDALTPRPMSAAEQELLALLCHDIGVHEKLERDEVFRRANNSPSERVALLWMASGSPEHNITNKPTR